MSIADEQKKIEEILAQFPGPVTLHVSRREWFGLAAGFLVFAAMGVWLLNRADPTLYHLIMCWTGIILFGTGAAGTFYVAVFPQTNQLTLRHNNFEAVDLFKRNNCSAEWQHASNFTTMTSHKWVGFYDDSGAFVAPPSSLSASLQTIRCNRLLSRTYGFTAEALAELMSRWGEKAVQQS